MLSIQALERRANRTLDLELMELRLRMSMSAAMPLRTCVTCARAAVILLVRPCLASVPRCILHTYYMHVTYAGYVLLCHSALFSKQLMQ